MSKKSKVFFGTILTCIFVTVGVILIGKLATRADDLAIIKANQAAVKALTGDTIRSVARMDPDSGMAVSGGDCILVGDTHEYVLDLDTGNICMFFAKDQTVNNQSKGIITASEAKKIAEKVYLAKMDTLSSGELTFKLRSHANGSYLYEVIHCVDEIPTGNKASIDISENGEVLAVAFVYAKNSDASQLNRKEDMLTRQKVAEFVCMAIEEYEKDNSKIEKLTVHVDEEYEAELDNIKGQLLWEIEVYVTAVTTSGEKVKEPYRVWVDAYSGASYRVAKSLNAVWDYEE